MRAKSIVLVVAVLGTACKGGGTETPTEPSSICFAGTSTYGASEAELVAAKSCDPSSADCNGSLPLILRRTLQPGDSMIVEEWVEGQGRTTFASKGSSVSKVDKDEFTYEVVLEVDPKGTEHKQETWTGAGELSGDPWMWTSWTAKQDRVPPGTDVITARIEGEAFVRSIDYTLSDGSVQLRRRDALTAFPCADWDARVEATLSAEPILRGDESVDETVEDAVEQPAVESPEG